MKRTTFLNYILAGVCSVAFIHKNFSNPAIEKEKRKENSNSVWVLSEENTIYDHTYYLTDIEFDLKKNIWKWTSCTDNNTYYLTYKYKIKKDLSDKHKEHLFYYFNDMKERKSLKDLNNVIVLEDTNNKNNLHILINFTTFSYDIMHYRVHRSNFMTFLEEASDLNRLIELIDERKNIASKLLRN